MELCFGSKILIWSRSLHDHISVKSGNTFLAEFLEEARVRSCDNLGSANGKSEHLNLWGIFWMSKSLICVIVVVTVLYAVSMPPLHSIVTLLTIYWGSQHLPGLIDRISGLIDYIQRFYAPRRLQIYVIYASVPIYIYDSFLMISSILATRFQDPFTPQLRP